MYKALPIVFWWLRIMVVMAPLPAFAEDCVRHTPTPDVSYTPNDGGIPAEAAPSWTLPKTFSLDLAINPELRQKDLMRDSNLPLGSITLDTKTQRTIMHTPEGSHDFFTNCD